MATRMSPRNARQRAYDLAWKLDNDLREERLKRRLLLALWGAFVGALAVGPVGILLGFILVLSFLPEESYVDKCCHIKVEQLDRIFRESVEQRQLETFREIFDAL